MRSVTIISYLCLLKLAQGFELRGSSETIDETEIAEKNAQRRNNVFKIKKSKKFGIDLMDVQEIDLYDLNTCNILQSDLMLYDDMYRAHDVLRIGDISISEKFRGQRIAKPEGGQIGWADIIKGKPNAPLDLKPSKVSRENVYVRENCMKNGSEACGIEIMGRTFGGFKGLGSLAVKFDDGKSRVTVYLKRKEGTTTQVGTNGATTSELRFYTTDAVFLGKMNVNVVEDHVYSFERWQGDIGGFTMMGKGDALSWHQFAIEGICVE